MYAYLHNQNFNEYFTHKNKIIFGSEFNDSLEPYMEIISSYNYLMFTDYVNYITAIKTNNKFKNYYSDQYSKSKYNIPIKKLPHQITHIKFGMSFNSFVELPTNLIYLEFGCDYILDVNLSNLNCLTNLIFGIGFNKKINYYPPSLTHLVFGYFYSQPLENLPTGLRYLVLGDSFNCCLNNLPDKLEFLSLGEKYSHPIILPQSLSSLQIEYTMISLVYELSNHTNLTNLQIRGIYTCDDKNYIKFPLNLKKLEFYNSYKIPQVIPQSITHLALRYCFEQEFNIPFRVKYLKLVCGKNQQILDNLPNNIEILYLDSYFSDGKLDNLPSSVKKIIFNRMCDYNNELNNLPSGLEFLQLPKHYKFEIINIPQKLKTLVCGREYSYIDSFANKFNKCDSTKSKPKCKIIKF